MAFHEPLVWYHVAGPRWQPGEPLIAWNKLVELGHVTDADWAHPGVAVGHDGDVISLWPDLEQARWYAAWKPRVGETLVRIRFPPQIEKIVFNAEEVPCYDGLEIPADWIEVVNPDETPWFPESYLGPR